VAMERAKPALVVWIDNHQQEYGHRWAHKSLRTWPGTRPESSRGW
jgi:hypothetical protein